MTNRNIYNSSFVLVFLLLSVLAAAQGRVTVKATIDRSQILIGEPIRLTLEADIPEDQPIRFFQVDSLPHFDFLKKEKIDTSNTSSGTVLSQLIHITSFDSGHWIIPSLVLYGDMVTDTIPVDVGFAPFDPQQPYHDIKDIIEVKPAESIKKRWWWYAAGAFLLVIAVLLLRKKKPVAVMAKLPDPYKTAMEQLENLQKKQNDSRQYYSKLVDIFRVYIFTKKGIHSLQKTTDDLVVQLRDLAIPGEQFDRLSQALRLSDFVKFARYIPTPEDDRAAFETVKSSIESIERIQ